MKQVNFYSTKQIPKNTNINVKSGLEIEGSVEYIDFGNYIINSNEWDADTNSYKHICYDLMLKTMLDYSKLDIIYPITIRDYINAICLKCGIEFANNNDVFRNYNKIINEDYFDYQLYTYRDILDFLAQLVGGFIIINSEDKLEIKYPTETHKILSKSYLNDKNITFKSKYGPINSIVFSRGGGSDCIYRKDEESIKKNGLCELKIKDNPFLEKNREQYIDELFEQMNGLYYYVCDIQSPGIMFFEVGDLFDFRMGNNYLYPHKGLKPKKGLHPVNSNKYKCLLLNDEIEISSGISETIYNEEAESELTNYKTSKPTDNSLKNAIITTNKNAGEIVLKVNSDGKIVQVELNGSADNGSVFNVAADNINLTANDVLNLIAGNSINLTSKNMTIDSDCLEVDSMGKVKIKTKDNSNQNLLLINQEGTEFERKAYLAGTGMFFYDPYTSGPDNQASIIINTILQGIPQISLTNWNTNVTTIIRHSGIVTPTLTQTSLSTSKKNFEKLENALDIIKNVDIYKYHLKDQKKSEKKHIGFVIGDEFNYSEEITSQKNDGVDLYSMISVCFKAIQEQQEIIENLLKERNK
jgi:hypothetical protein